MYNTLGIVQPYGLAENRGRLARKLGGKSLLEWVVRHVTDCQRLDRVVVVLGPGRAEQAIADLCPPDVPVFIGSRGDALGCCIEALGQFPCQSLVRVYADHPYTDPVLIDRLVKTADEHPSCDYISYCFRDGKPAILSSVGVFGEWCLADALRRAHAEAKRPADREHVTRYLFSHPEKFNIRLIPAPEELDRQDLRLGLQGEEEWERIQAIYEAHGSDAVDWRRIAAHFGGHAAPSGVVGES